MIYRITWGDGKNEDIEADDWVDGQHIHFYRDGRISVLINGRCIRKIERWTEARAAQERKDLEAKAELRRRGDY